MAYIHFSHVTCDDCGERHTPDNPTACIELLKSQRDEALIEFDGAINDLRIAFDPVIPDAGSRDGNLCRIKDAIADLVKRAHAQQEVQPK